MVTSWNRFFLRAGQTNVYDLSQGKRWTCEAKNATRVPQLHTRRYKRSALGMACNSIVKKIRDKSRS